MTINEPEIIEYSVDENNLICKVSSGWDPFATANKAIGLLEKDVIGKSLLSFIGCDQTRHLYELLLHRVRQDKQKLAIHFRCDAPEFRRYLCLNITPAQGGGIDFSCERERVEERQSVELLDTDTERSDQLVTICSWCKKMRLDQDTWEEIEVAVDRTQLFMRDRLPQITHGMCPTCFDRLYGDAETADEIDVTS